MMRGVRVHRPVKDYCHPLPYNHSVDDSNLVVHHYLGTWQQFSFRNDARQGDGFRTSQVRILYIFLYYNSFLAWYTNSLLIL